MRSCLLILAFVANSVLAAAAAPTLTLEAVLAQADAPHPDIDLARAQQATAQAEQQYAESLNDFRVTLEGALRSGVNPLFGDGFTSDNQVRLNARKTLFDAGRRDTGLAATRDESAARDLQLLDSRSQRRLTLMARFFDVLLAEMQYAAETEFMAGAYVNWDNAKDARPSARWRNGSWPTWKRATSTAAPGATSPAQIA